MARGVLLVASAVVVALLGGATGCRREPTLIDSATPAAPGAAPDVRLVATNPSTFTEDFDGGPGRLFAGWGWYGLEEGVGAWAHYAWVSQEAVAYFGSPLRGNGVGGDPGADVELRLRLHPYTYENSPPQTLRLTLDGAPLGEFPLRDGWNDLGIALPADGLDGPLHELAFAFDRAAAPREVGEGADYRRLAAAVDYLTVAPRGRRVAGDEARRAAIGWFAGGEEREGEARAPDREPGWDVDLPAGEAVALPVPAGHHCRVRSRPAPGASQGLLRVSLLEGRARRTLGTTPAGAELGFDCRSPRPLRIEVTAEPGGPRRQRVILAPVAASGAPAGPASEARGRPPVFIYLIDTLRADALEPYGSPRPTSPRIREFARDGVVYERATSPSSWTVPAVHSILSGLYPFGHGVRLIGQGIGPETPWLPAELASAGYETLGLSQWPFGRGRFDRGFASFAVTARLFHKSRADVLRGLFWEHSLNRRRPGAPLFAYVHAVDPHQPYQPTGGFRRYFEETPGMLPDEAYQPVAFQERRVTDPRDVARLRAAYDGEVAYSDEQFGRFLDLLRLQGIYEESLIILVSDHGEEFFEHGGFDHGRTLHEELLRVPLIVKYPGNQGGGGRVADPVSTVDIVPTVLDAARLAGAGRRFHGRRLPVEPTPGASAPRELYAQTGIYQSALDRETDLWMVRRGDLKCVVSEGAVDRFDRPALPVAGYDLAADPDERAPREPGACADLVARWRAVRERGALNITALEDPLSEEARANLRALGYLQ